MQVQNAVKYVSPSFVNNSGKNVAWQRLGWLWDWSRQRRGWYCSSSGVIQHCTSQQLMIRWWKHTRISHSRGCNCNDGGHSNKGGQEETGHGVGQHWGGGRLQSGSKQSAIAALTLPMQGQRKQCKGSWRRTQLPHSSFRDRLRQAQALGNGSGGWRALAVNGGVSGGC